MADIVFDSVERSFKQGSKEFLAVGGINLTVKDREFVAIVGPSGCGKTTCMRMVAGLEMPSKGRVLVMSRPIPINYLAACNNALPLPAHTCLSRRCC